MKILKKAIFPLFAALILVSNSFAVLGNTKTYGEFDTFAELEEAYYEAVENNDYERQNVLLVIAEKTLKQEIARSEMKREDIDEFIARQNYYKYITSSKWITRDGLISLSIQPKGISSVGDTWNNTQKQQAWEGVYVMHYRDSNWKNTSSMKEQFYCHARLFYASNKQPWNIEPSKTSINPITCN